VANITAGKPNILLFFTDQQRWDALGCVGDWVRTPNLDRMASEGVLFTQCVTNAPVCVPARFSLATGWYPHNTGVWRNVKVSLPGNAPTWVRALRDSGYRTSLFGKTHLHSYLGRPDLRDNEHLLRAYGFDDVNEVPGPRGAARIGCHMTAEWEQRGLLDAYRRDMRERLSAGIPIVRPSPLGLDNYYDVYVGRQAAAYLHEYNHAQPWFCWVGFPGPHEPWDVPEPYASMYEPEASPNPIPYTADRWRRGPARPHGWFDKKLRKRGGRVSRRLAKRLRANYAGSVTLIDDLAGEIIDVVRHRGELDRTVVVFSSDHGEMNGDFGLVGKSNMLDAAVRVPLIIRIPSARAPNTRFDGPVELIDLGPTLVELGGGALRHRQFGRSLVPVLETPDAHHRSDAVVELRREIMLFDPSWKMTVNARGDPYLLFDRKKDPEERHNLAGTAECRDVERQLIARLRERIRQTELRDGDSRLC
jgi:choline-sulfatase